MAFRRGASGRSRSRKNEAETEPERIYALKECCDMLLAGGYFRARIPTLSPFDRVVGGLVWSITASGMAVDVDIIFEENSTIGERIKLSENIVKATIKMKCPHPLQSHQIQGLDYAKLFPVIQWLVRKVIEYRVLTGDTVRQLSVAQFGQTYEWPEEARPAAAASYVDSMLTDYVPKRKFRQRAGASFETVQARTEATLLEYGEKIFTGEQVVDEEAEEKRRARQANRRGGGRVGNAAAALAGKLGGGDAGGAGGGDADAELSPEAKAAAEAEQRRLDALKGQLVEGSASDAQISGENIGSLVGMQSDALREAAEAHQEEMNRLASEGGADGGASGISGARAAELSHQRQVEAFKRKITALRNEIEEGKEGFLGHEAKAQEIATALEEANQYQARAVAATEQLEAQERDAGNQEVLAALKGLVMLNENLKQQKEAFKANCARELERLQGRIAGVEDDDTDEEAKRMREIERIYETDSAKLAKLRHVLARKNQQISRIRRDIDDIPTRAELLQFERRFVELYELVAEKLKETRKYYALYNTLDDSHGYMTKENSLLNSIIKGFPDAMKTNSGKENFLESFARILEGVSQSKEHVVKEQAATSQEKETLLDRANKLMDRERKYFKSVKAFQEACRANEELTDALAAAERSA